MHSFRFLHAADLHLDAAFQGITAEAARFSSQPNISPTSLSRLSGNSFGSSSGFSLTRTTFTALERLVKLAIAEKVDAVLLAGDIYNVEDASLKAQLALRDACKTLHTHNIPVAIAHGNHDPYTSRLATITWPPNVTIFGTEEVEQLLLGDPLDPTAVIHGLSHGKKNERRNLAKQFARSSHPCYQIGLLHCTVDTAAKADRYAPCTVKDLVKSGMDYWALGHVHEQQTLHTTPWVMYSGSIQGLHINEEGPKGCLIIDVQTDGTTVPIFHQLGPVCWHTVTISAAGISSADMLEQHIVKTLEAYTSSQGQESMQEPAPQQFQETGQIQTIQQAQGNTQTFPAQGYIFRIRLTGKTSLNQMLRQKNALTDLLERIRETMQGQTPFVWVKDIELATRAETDMQNLRSRPDLLGEALRHAEVLRSALLLPVENTEGQMADVAQPDSAASSLPPASHVSLAASPSAPNILDITDSIAPVDSINTGDSSGAGDYTGAKDSSDITDIIDENTKLENLMDDVSTLYDHARAKKYLNSLSEKELASLLADAEELCAELLETE